MIHLFVKFLRQIGIVEQSPCLNICIFEQDRSSFLRSSILFIYVGVFNDIQDYSACVVLWFGYPDITHNYRKIPL